MMLTVWRSFRLEASAWLEGRFAGHVQTGFMGIRRSLMVPNLANISRMWPSLTFLVNASTTICDSGVSSGANRAGSCARGGLALLLCFWVRASRLWASHCVCSSCPCHLAIWFANEIETGRRECSFCVRCGEGWLIVCASESGRGSAGIESREATVTVLGLSVWEIVSVSGRVGFGSAFATASGPLVMASAMAWPEM